MLFLHLSLWFHQRKPQVKYEHQEWDLFPTNLLTEARWLEYVASTATKSESRLMLLYYNKEPPMKNVYRFTEYRINHVRNRRSGMGGTMVSRQIDHLHNLRLQLDRRLRKHPSRYKRRNYYQPVPRYKGGYDTRGKLPATINHLVDRLRERAEPAIICHFVPTSEESLRL